MISKEWLDICQGYAVLRSITPQRAYQLSLLIWFHETVGDNDLFDPMNYQDFRMMLQGKSPVKGRWVKSAERTKTKGTIRPEDDPTCFSWKDFYKAYQFSKGSVKAAKLAYSKLPEDIRQVIKDTVHLYVQDTSIKDVKGVEWKPRRAHASRYINDAFYDQYRDKITERDWSVPNGAEFPWSGNYKEYLLNLALGNSELSDSTLKLTYTEYAAIMDKCWEKDFKINVGPSVLSSISADAHKKSVQHGGLVFDNFIQLLKEKA